MFLLLYLVAVLSNCEASEFKFSLSRSTDWQYVGRRVKYTLEMTIPETTQLKTKIKCPFNTSAILRLTKTEVTEVTSQLTVPNTSPNLTSSANDGLHDIAFFEFGEVTRATYENETKIKIEFEIQVMDHQEIVNGGLQWVSVGTEYKNQSVWAAMLAVKTVKPACKRPDLKVTLWSVSNYHTVRSGDQINLRVDVEHSDDTTDLVENGKLQLPLPPFLTYNDFTKFSNSVSVVAQSDSQMVSFKFEKLEFYQKVSLSIKLNLDPGKTRADGKIHDCTVYVNLKYNGSADTCSSASGSREFSHQGPSSASFKYYVQKAKCDKALGLQDKSITDSKITGSSYSSGGEPHEARLGGSKAWIPSGQLAKEKSQFLQVDFTDVAKVCRLTTQGFNGSFVTRLSLFYSDDGVIWKPYKEGSKIKEFAANTNDDYTQIIVLQICIQARFIRINPVGWYNSIALRVEFFGCTIGPAPSSGSLTFTSRGYLLDKSSDIMYVCSVPMKGSKSAPNCFRSEDKGNSWTGLDNRLLTLVGHDKDENILFGVSKNGKAILKSTTDHLARFVAVPEDEWVKAKTKSNTVLTKMLENSLAIADANMNPQSPHTVTADNSGTEWGASAQGIHVKQSSQWKLKAIWMCSELGNK